MSMWGSAHVSVGALMGNGAVQCGFYEWNFGCLQEQYTLTIETVLQDPVM